MPKKVVQNFIKGGIKAVSTFTKVIRFVIDCFSLIVISINFRKKMCLAYLSRISI